MIKNILCALTVAMSMACGVSPYDADQGLQHMSEHIEANCGVDHQYDPSVDVVSNEVLKLTFIPDGFGFTNSYGCFDSPWDGGFCFVPRFKEAYVRLNQNGQDNGWFSVMNQEFGQWRDRLNANFWEIKKWQSGNPAPRIEAHTGTTHPTGYLGRAVTSNHVFTSGAPNGEYASYNKCDVYLYRTSIEANQFYQAANSTQKNRYLKNLWDHEFSHCSGLAHTQGTLNTLMSVDYTYPGPYFDSNLSPTQAEDNMLTAFNPIN